jgi:hypothetical protein
MPSESAGPGVVVVLGMLGVALLVVGAWWFARQREKRLREFAAQIGWRYVGTDPNLRDRWKGMPFGTGSSRRVSEVLVGTYAGRPAVSFQYRYTTGSGDDRQTHTFHVIALSLPVWLPGLQLTPQGLGARLAMAFGGQDIELESADFNKAWRVEARDAKFASDVLHPRTMERLLRADARGLSLRLEGGDVLCWEAGSHDIDVLAARLGVMSALADGIPRFVWLDNGYDPAHLNPQGET